MLRCSHDLAQVVGHQRDVCGLRAALWAPPPPMAMPTSALASAGASLTPSPTMATLSPCF